MTAIVHGVLLPGTQIPVGEQPAMTYLMHDIICNVYWILCMCVCVCGEMIAMQVANFVIAQFV